MNIAEKVLNVLDRAIAPPSNKAAPAKAARIDPYKSRGADFDRAVAAEAAERKKQTESDRRDAEARRHDPSGYSLNRRAEAIAAELGLPFQPGGPPSADYERGFGMVVQPVAGALTGPVLAGACKEAGVELIDAAGLKALRAVGERWRELQGLIESHLHSSEAEVKLVAEDQAKIGTPEFRGLTREMAHDLRFQQRRGYGRAQDQLFEMEARPILQGVLTRLTEGLNAALAQTITVELQQSAARGIPFTPSTFCATLLKALESLGNYHIANTVPLGRHFYGVVAVLLEGKR